MRLALVFLLGFTVLSPAGAQVFDAIHLGDSVDLSGNWRFYIGDDLRWAQPDFDDSQWRIISTFKSWHDQGVRDFLTGFAWYRAKVQLPPNHGPLAFFFNYAHGNYQLFVNGQQIGRLGTFPPNGTGYASLPQNIPIPKQLAGGDSLQIAIRFWFDPVLAGNDWGALVSRGQQALVLGYPDSTQRWYDVWLSRTLYGWLPDYTVRFLAILLAAGLLVLYRLQPGNREYLWIACSFACLTAGSIHYLWRQTEPFPALGSDVFGLLTNSGADFFAIQFVFAFLKLPMPRLMRIYQVSLLFQVLIIPAVIARWMSIPTANLLLYAWWLPYFFVVPGLILWWYFRGNKEAGLLAIPFVLVNLNDILNTIGEALYFLKLRHTINDLTPTFNLGVIPITTSQIELLLVVLSIAALLLYRFNRTSHEQAFALAELEAARSIQELMLPLSETHTPGFLVRSAYVPAQQVGGDFFQYFPCRDSSLLVIVGDVSGKGVKAAMLVSLIVGILQEAVTDTQQPARLLEALNSKLTGRMDGRFATCCATLLQNDGEVLIANAGHLSPYCDGEELEVPGGLPLGLAPDTAYEQVRYSLPPNSRLVFLSDGVVEARNKAGELYGFERARSISTQPTAEIVRVAQAFGQEDDITVIEIERQPAPVLVSS